MILPRGLPYKTLQLLLLFAVLVVAYHTYSHLMTALFRFRASSTSETSSQSFVSILSFPPVLMKVEQKQHLEQSAPSSSESQPRRIVHSTSPRPSPSTITSTMSTTTTKSTPSTTPAPPFAVNNYLRYLQALFAKYTKHFQENSTDTRLTSGDVKAFQLQTTYQERMQMYDLMRVFDEVMHQHNVPYMLYAGTLLGSYRHHDFIPWDDDLDVFVPFEFKSKMEELMKPLSPRYQLFHAGGHDKLARSDGKRAGPFSWLWPYVDISYYRQNITHIWDDVDTYGIHFSFPKKAVFPLHMRPLFNMSFPAPHDTLAFLIWSYGFNSSCVMYGYSHMREGAGPHGRKGCEEMASEFPFVEHVAASGGVREIMRIGREVWRDVIVDEPAYAVGEMFRIAMKPGFTAPPGVFPDANFSSHM